MLPIYWLVNMSLKTNQEILSGFSLIPQQPSLANYALIFGDPSWYNGYITSIIYVVLTTVISVSFALPAAHAFPLYRFIGHKPRFLWLLTNRLLPPAVVGFPLF